MMMIRMMESGRGEQPARHEAEQNSQAGREQFSPLLLVMPLDSSGNTVRHWPPRTRLPAAHTPPVRLARRTAQRASTVPQAVPHGPICPPRCLPRLMQSSSVTNTLLSFAACHARHVNAVAAADMARATSS
ncbi:hypothetical protein CDD81_2597 [Ophiocordyceps australis]|uniref:Uncharacterized protein n=1 Tax=Ophiocordyceps australis TaxID=1399860 RepID=A0A2C5X7I8_9HYPO|nr:hypothetical protein CDD81_2597 [Ophiocordyceps australis]